MRRYLQILVANLLIAAAFAFIAVPQVLIGGGMASLSLILSHWVALPIYAWLAILLLAMLAACLLILGKQCFLRSALSCLICFAMFVGFSQLRWTPSVSATAAAVLAGLLVGIGMGLCLRAGASTLGTDTLGLFLHRASARIPVWLGMYVSSLLILALGMKVYHWRALLRGVCFATVQALALELTLRMNRRVLPDFRTPDTDDGPQLSKQEMPKQYTTVLFDLDGTLTDPGLGITNSILYAMQQENMTLPPRQELYQFIGPPLVEAFQSVFGVTEPQALRMLTNFRVYFEKQGIYENAKYEQIDEVLTRLRDAGCRLAVATSKPERFAIMVLDYFELTQYFELVAGADLDETRTAKSAVVAYALERLGEPDRSTVIMVGDRSHDVVGGKKNALATMGVLYGYGNRAELEGAGADLLAETVSEVADLLLTGKS